MKRPARRPPWRSPAKPANRRRPPLFPSSYVSGKTGPSYRGPPTNPTARRASSNPPCPRTWAVDPGPTPFLAGGIRARPEGEGPAGASGPRPGPLPLGPQWADTAMPAFWWGFRRREPPKGRAKRAFESVPAPTRASVEGLGLAPRGKAKGRNEPREKPLEGPMWKNQKASPPEAAPVPGVTQPCPDRETFRCPFGHHPGSWPRGNATTRKDRPQMEPNPTPAGPPSSPLPFQRAPGAWFPFLPDGPVFPGPPTILRPLVPLACPNPGTCPLAPKVGAVPIRQGVLPPPGPGNPPRKTFLSPVDRPRPIGLRPPDVGGFWDRPPLVFCFPALVPPGLGLECQTLPARKPPGPEPMGSHSPETPRRGLSYLAPFALGKPTLGLPRWSGARSPLGPLAPALPFSLLGSPTNPPLQPFCPPPPLVVFFSPPAKDLPEFPPGPWAPGRAHGPWVAVPRAAFPSPWV